jgi:hypothetical protein
MSSSSFRRRSVADNPTSGIAGPVKMPSLASLGGGSTVGGDLTESGHADDPEGGDPNNNNGGGDDFTKDNLEIMREIVMRIRTDPDFAASIYADCPRLQHLLEQRPDLRPIFEDPDLVKINFEQVYRDAGGKLPEDEEAEAEAKRNTPQFRVILAKIVNHPLFKVLRFLLLIKKVVSCATGGGVSMIRGFFHSSCCSADGIGGHDPSNADGGHDGNNGGHDGTNGPDGPDASNNAETKAALNKVAAHMEDPEVQAQMHDLLEHDPDGLQDAINNDPDLKALRDSNPLCAELMKDPDTMRILVDPDNLRALGDCPDLIEQDFADPDWSPPDVEAGGIDPTGAADHGGMAGADQVIDLDGASPPDGDVVEIDLDGDGHVDGFDVDGDGHVDVDVDADGDADGNGDDGNVLDDYQLGDDNGGNDNNGGGGGPRGGGGGGNRNRSQGGQNQARSGFVSSVGAGFTDLIAQQVVGMGVGDLMPGMFGGGGGGMDDMLGGLADGGDVNVDDGGAVDQAAASSADQAGAATGQFAAVSGALDGTNTFLNDSYGNQLDTLEKGMDDLEQQADALADAGDRGADAAAAATTTQGPLAGGAAMGVAAAEGAIIGTAFTGNNNNERQQGRAGSRSVGVAIPEDEPMVDDGDDEPEKKGRFGWVGGLGSALATAAKESIAGAILGSDLGELVVEKQEERQDEKKKEKEEQNRSKSNLNASRSDLNSSSRSRNDLWNGGGSNGDLSGSSRSDMNRSRSNLPDGAATEASPKGKSSRSLKK